MFDVGFWELLLIAIVALLVVGPERLPGMARTVGLWVGRLRRYLYSVRADFEREIDAEELRQTMKNQDLQNAIKEPAKIFAEAVNSVRKQTADLQTQTEELINDPTPTPTRPSAPAQTANLQTQTEELINDPIPTPTRPSAPAQTANLQTQTEDLINDPIPTPTQPSAPAQTANLQTQTEDLINDPTPTPTQPSAPAQTANDAYTDPDSTAAPSDSDLTTATEPAREPPVKPS